jgi:ParB/RepB/Spo0J family partition protein
MTDYPELSGYKTLEIPTSAIHCDHEFNCRGQVTPISCIELAESMRSKGLKIPIMVQPRHKGDHEYRIIAGHRRFTAAKYLLGWGSIPATVLENLSDEDAQILNLVENLERKDLSLYEQAVALRRSFPEGTSIVKMALALNKSDGWVRLRWRIMEAAPELQELIKQGILGITDFQTLAYKTETEQRAIAAEVKVAGMGRGGVRGYKKNRLTARRSRPLRDIDEMLTILTTKGLYPDPFKALAWAANRLSDEELLKSNIDSE